MRLTYERSYDNAKYMDRGYFRERVSVVMEREEYLRSHEVTELAEVLDVWLFGNIGRIDIAWDGHIDYSTGARIVSIHYNFKLASDADKFHEALRDILVVFKLGTSHA